MKFLYSRFDRSTYASIFAKTLSLIFLTFTLFSHLSGRANDIIFDRISTEHGLSQSSVLCILQDSKGFMWFGTQDGLNRYDGYRFTVYKNEPDNSNSLNWNYITCLYEDPSEKVLWIGTRNGGLNKLDLITETFTHYTSNPDVPESLSHNNVRSIYRDRSGKLWIGTLKGLNLFNPEKETFTVYQNDPGNLFSLSNDFVKVIYEDRSGVLWVGTDFGLNKAAQNDSDSLNFVHFNNHPGSPNGLSSNNVKSIYQDRSGTLWVGTIDGLNRFEPETENFIRYKHRQDTPGSLSDNDVQVIFEDRTGTLWIGTYGGLNRFEPARQSFTHFKYNPEDPNSLSHNNIKSIYEDRSKILWIGTLNRGLNRLDTQTKKFEFTKNEPGNPNSLSNNDVRSFYEDKSAQLWIGTDYGGLNKFDRKSNRFTHYRHDPTNPQSLSHNGVVAIQEDQSGVLWIATDFGLNRFHPETATFTRYHHQPGNPATLSSDYLIVMYEDRSGVLWIGTNTNGLNKYNRGSGTFTHYASQPDNPESLSHYGVRSIYEDRSGVLWIGTDAGGLNKFDRETETFTHYKNDPSNPNSLSNNVVFSIHEDRSGFLWIGTLAGLNRFDRANETFTHFTEKDGLPNNAVYGILGDDNGDLWLSTNRGLSKLILSKAPPASTVNTPADGGSKGKLEFKNYDISDGVQGNEFNSGAYYKSRGGEMFFGGNNGFTNFYPDSIKDNPYVPEIVITDFQIYNKSVPVGTNGEENGRPSLQKHISETREITLSYVSNVFSFEFAALHYSAPEKNQYAYKMEGFDKHWNYVGNKHEATYTNLDPGEYVLRVKGSNSDGVWNETGTSIKIIIMPPFWQTWWFRVVMILSTLMLAGILHKRRLAKIQAKKAALEIQVKEKTEAAIALQTALSEVEKLKNRLYAENVYLQDEIKLTHNFSDIIGRSEALKRVLHKVEKVSVSDATVLILGESGTGKELLARAVHNLSRRRDRPLVKVNCATLPANLIESELFGHEKGAFTGALARKIGHFELADGGTIFLDEIGDLPLALQAKLLRVLQEGEIERLGNPQAVKIDARVIAATNRDLDNAIRKGLFREDLFYRLNVFPIKSPSLRERKEDLPLLVNYFIKKYSAKAGKKIETVSQTVLETLQAYDWPGNVRELENIIERAVVVSQGNQFKLADWLPMREAILQKDGIATLEENERAHIIKALKKTAGRISGEQGAAKLLGINDKTLYSRMQKLGIKKSQLNIF